VEKEFEILDAREKFFPLFRYYNIPRSDVPRDYQTGERLN
jgi:hypothetical protein